MKMPCLVLLSTVAFVTTASVANAAATGVPGSNQLYGHVTSDRTLSHASPGPVYEVIGDLTIDPGVTLTVERGVRVLATPNSDFLASGNDPTQVEIIVAGTLRVPAGSDSVLFSAPSASSVTWAGIRTYGSGRLDISDATLTNCSTAIDASVGTLTLRRCSITSCSAGIVCNGGWESAPDADTLDTCAIYNVPYALSYTGRAENLLLRGCRIDYATYGVIMSTDDNGVFGCADSLAPAPTIIRGCQYGVLAFAKAAITRFVISDCTYGIFTYNDFSCRVDYCTLVNNRTGITSGGNYGPGLVTNSLIVSFLGYGTGLAGRGATHHTDVWGFGGSAATFGAFVLGAPMSCFNPYFLEGDSDYHLSPASFFTNYSPSGGEIGAYGPGAPGPAPAESAVLMSADGTGGVARLSWYVGSVGSKAAVLRRSDGADWAPRAVLYSGPDGMVSLADTAVTSGTSYDYAIGTLSDGVIGFAGNAAVTVDGTIDVGDGPLVMALGSPSVAPNPAAEGWTISFAAPSTAPARVEVLDVAGRLRLSRELRSVTAGRNSTYLPAERLSPGVYWVRVRQAGSATLARAVKVR